MTRIRFVVAATFVIQVALAGVAATAQAVSAGFYGSYGAGAASRDDWVGGGYGEDGDTRHTGAGLALEMPTGFFATSYRLGIGWEHIDSEGTNGGPDRTLEGLVIDQDITYDLFASPAMRFWIGPELRLGFLHGSFDNASGGDGNYFAAGIGPVLGFDIALNRSVALSWKLGYLFTWYSSDEGSWGNDYYDDYYYDGDTIDEGQAYISLSVLFRLWGGPLPGPHPDMYQPQGRW